LTVCPVPPYRPFDTALVFAHNAVHESHINLLYRSLFELLNKILMGFICFGDHEHAAGAFVQSVDDPRSLCSPQSRERPTSQKLMNNSSLEVSRCRVDDHPRGFIKSQERFIFVENRKPERLGD
jgi:hypothetical protein